MVNEPAPKRPRTVEDEDAEDGESQLVVAAAPSPATTFAAATSSSSTRSSSLPYPTLQLTGHTGSVYAVEYSPRDGHTLCSASFDMTCLLWRHRDDDADYYVYDPASPTAADYNPLQSQPAVSSTTGPVVTATYENYGVLKGHKNAVLDCAWCDDSCIVTASADATVMLWDVTSGGTRLRKWDREHTKIVNAVTRVSPHELASASDDKSVLLWDRRQKRPAARYATDYPVLAVTASGEGGGGPAVLFTAGIDPHIYAWDLRRTETPIYRMSGHGDTVTCLAMHPDSTHLLSNSMDQTLKTWDLRPFIGKANKKRHCKTFTGHVHSPEKGQLLKCAWSKDGSMVSAGSSDHRVHIWDEISTQELYDLPGHSGCVNAVTFHPTESTVIASASSDKQIYVGELS